MPATHGCYAFGGFVLEPAQRRLLQADGTAIALTPRLFDALLLLVEHAGELLDKNHLMTALWPGLVVEENNLSQVVAGLRRALGDDAQGSRFIQTVPRHGFRFIASVTRLPAAAAEAPPALPEPSGSVSRPAPPRRQLLALTAGLAATAAGWAAWSWHRTQQRAAPDPWNPVTTLAVLPFRPLVAEGRDELLEVGMADSLIARLSTMSGLAVRSTGSVLRYAGPGQDPLRAARELEVAWIVDGSLQRRGDEVRATARLLRSADGSAAWSGSFDQKFIGVFDAQEQIAARLMEALAPTLRAAGTAAAAPVELGGTRSLDAYQLYLTAAWRSQGGRAADIDRAIALLNQALAIDPGYALAWALLAWSHRRRLWNADAVPADVFEPANLAVQRALALVPDLAPGLAGRGFGRYLYDFDWAGAEKDFRSAVARAQNEVSPRWGLAQLLLTQGRLDEGFMHIRVARELDPMSPVLNTLEASFLLDHGRREEARTRLNRALDIAPLQWLSHVALGLLHFAEQQNEAGIAELRRAVELSSGTTRPHAMLAVHLARLGRRGEAQAIRDELLARSKARYVSPISLASVHAALGEVEPALAGLELAYRVRDTRLIYLKDDPHWAGLRQEPRFVALRQRLGLDRYGPGLSPV